ncbi:MAG: acyltransferase [Flavobacteriaceae bacterium]
MIKKTIYLPGLNGIRGICAIAVVIYHTTLGLDFFGLDPHILGTYKNGNPKSLEFARFAISIFFVLSGFLITYLLCKEKEVRQINLKKFYARRILRIWPLYYAYIILCLIVCLIFGIDYLQESFLFYIFHGANVPYVFGGSIVFLTHYWSLGVEEQFYLFWPMINKFKTRNILLVSLLGIVIFMGLKIGLHLFTPGSKMEFFLHATRFHCILIGCVAAILYYLNNSVFIKIATNKFVQIICWGMMLLALLNRFHIISFLDHEIISVVAVVIIIGQITKSSPISLENRYLNFFGKISYGIYVIHPLIIFLISKTITKITFIESWNYVSVYFVILFSTIVVASLSYNYYESFFLRIKRKKFSVIRSNESF